jgi:ABC-type lipoprotein export system ATPase subunit
VSAVELRDVFRVHSTPEGDAAALQGLTLTVAEGELLAVLGPSGSGKTSMLLLLAGVDRASAGTARAFGSDLGRLGARALARYRARTIGYVDQRYAQALDPRLTIADSIALRLRLEGDPRADRRVRELLDAVGLADRRLAYPAELSGGEQQRVAVCAALAHRPRLLLADEPTGELDRASADVVFELVAELARAHGTTVIVVSHDARAAEFADRAVRIRDGRISEERRDGADRIVVARGGWIRLPEEALRGAGVGERAAVRVRGREIVVTAAEANGAEPLAPGGSVPRLARSRLVEVRRVTKRYARRVVLDGLDADFDRGALTAVTGPSGSGKTTLLDLVAGLELPDSGSVDLLGLDVASLDRAGRAALRRGHVGYVAQQPELVPFLSARENVALGLRLHGRPVDGAIPALDAVGLADRAEQRVERLSGGERFRVAIARALAPRPDVLIADEPTSRLDEANALGVASLLSRLAREWGAAVIVASHDPLVVELADERLELGATLPA